jgi:hypothetical protein
MSSLAEQKRLAEARLEELVQDGDLKTIQELESKGADIHYDNDTLFVHACGCGRLDIAMYLYNKNIGDEAYDAALGYASQNGYFDVVKFIVLDCEFKLGDECEGVYAARARGQTEIMNFLIAHGATLEEDED